MCQISRQCSFVYDYYIGQYFNFYVLNDSIPKY